MKQHIFEDFDSRDAYLSDRQVMIQAVRHDGMSLQYAATELRADREVVFEAIRENKHALKWASKKLRGKKELLSGRGSAAIICTVEAVVITSSTGSSIYEVLVGMAGRSIRVEMKCFHTVGDLACEKSAVLLPKAISYT